jgi:MATE family multidrug resistance protein
VTLKTYTQEFSKNLKLAYPVILGMLGHTLVGIVDNMMVGQLGATALAAVSLGNSFVFVAMSIGIGFSSAITPLVAASSSIADEIQTKSLLKNSVFLCVLLGFLLFFSILLFKPLISLMNQPKEVVELAMPYLDIVAFSLIPLIWFQAYKQFADGLSFTKYAMYATFLANGVNVLINYLLIYGVWVFPRLELVGAAIGTLISRVVMVFFIIWLMKNNERFTLYFTGFNMQSIKKSICKKILKLGIPSAMQMFFEVVLFVGAVWISGLIDTPNQAANQIAMSVVSFTFMFALGVSVATTIRVGHHFGQQNIEKVKLVAYSNFLLTIMLMFGFALIFFIFHQSIPHLFLDENIRVNQDEIKLVIKIASQLILIAAFFQLFDGLQVVILGALKGMQDVKIPTIITFVAYWVIGFSLMSYLALCTSLKAQGIWIGFLVSLFASSALLFWRFQWLIKRR